MYNLGLCFLQLFDYEAATVAFSRALQHSLQQNDLNAEGAICAAQAVSNALSGDFQKVDSCFDRFIEITGIQEVGLETTLGLQSVFLLEHQENVRQVVSKQVLFYSQLSVVVLMRISGLARVHGRLEKARYFAQRAYNVAQYFQFGKLSDMNAVLLGVAKGYEELVGNKSDTEGDIQVSNLLESLGICQLQGNEPDFIWL